MLCGLPVVLQVMLCGLPVVLQVMLCGLPVVLQAVVHTTGRPPIITEVIPRSHISNAEPTTRVNIPYAWVRSHRDVCGEIMYTSDQRYVHIIKLYIYIYIHMSFRP